MASDGTPIRDGRVIGESEAAIIRQISSDFAAGKSPRKIALISMAAASGGRATMPEGHPHPIHGNRAVPRGLH
jgi:hypothetical protein